MKIGHDSRPVNRILLNDYLLHKAYDASKEKVRVMSHFNDLDLTSGDIATSAKDYLQKNWRCKASDDMVKLLNDPRQYTGQNCARLAQVALENVGTFE